MSFSNFVMIGGDTYFIEVDRYGKKWGVNEFYRVPLKSLFENWRKMIDEAHAVGVK